MAWFDEFNLPGATIDGYFGFVQADGPDVDDNPDVVLANGTVTFTATTEAARVDGAWLGIQPVKAQIFEGQIVISEEDPRPVRLLATDADVGVEDWAWRATFNVPGVKFEPLTFKAPRDTTVNLTANLIPIESAPYQIVKGDSIVDAEADATGRLRFEISNGSFTNWVAVPVGPHTHDLGDVAGLAARLAALEQKTGIRRITLPSGGNLTVQRARDSVRININGAVVPAGQSGDVTIWTVPAGFRAMQTERGIMQEGSAGPFRFVNVLGGSNLYARNVSANAALYGWITYETADPFPSTLPGTPA